MNDDVHMLERLDAALADLDPSLSPAAALERLVRLGLDALPLPGAGRTLQRWQALAAVAEHDLSLAKLCEGHTDALAILRELGHANIDAKPATWGVWAAESPEGRATLAAGPDGGVLLNGAKCWCSGAASASHALLTAWYPDGRGPQLVAIEIDQPAVEVQGESWQAVGMAGSASLDVHFRGAAAMLVGQSGDYLRRPGFWHGGAGIAACWYGGARGLAKTLRVSLADADRAATAARNPFRLATLGKVDTLLESTAALLREAASWIDRHPADDASAIALRVRLSAEDCARRVLDEAGRALGAAPFCRDRRFARAAADLPVFIRQSHAERDFAVLGQRLLAMPEPAWTL